MDKALIKIPLLKEFIEWRKYSKILDLRTLSIEKRTKLMMDKYQRMVGYKMDINNPKTFTEKLQWYKLFYKGNEEGGLIRIVDKYLFKEYIREKIGEGYTIPYYGVYETFDELLQGWNFLPEEFVLKSTLSYEGRKIKFIHQKSQINTKELKVELKNWFKDKYLLCNSLCTAYHQGKPRVLAEKYMENIKNQLFDYKVFCFGGEPFCIETAIERFEKGIPVFTFYDLHWNKMNVQSGKHPVGDVEKPKHFDEIIRISKILSKGFPHVRVDFFDTEEKPYLAEMTFFTGGGYQKYTPESFNIKMGELFFLPQLTE